MCYTLKKKTHTPQDLSSQNGIKLIQVSLKDESDLKCESALPPSKKEGH